MDDDWKPPHGHYRPERRATRAQRFAAAEVARQKFAEECGLNNFAEVIAFGIVKAAKRGPVAKAKDDRPPAPEIT